MINTYIKAYIIDTESQQKRTNFLLKLGGIPEMWYIMAVFIQRAKPSYYIHC